MLTCINRSCTIILLLLLFVCEACTTTNKNFITVSIQDCNKGDTIRLNGYNGSYQIKTADTILDNKGIGVFLETPLESGLYTIVSRHSSFDFLISNNQPQNFSIFYDGNTPIFNQSNENTAFVLFGKYIAEQIAVKDILIEMSADNIEEQKLMLNKFNEQLQNKINEIKLQFPQSTLALYAELSNQIISGVVVWDSIDLSNAVLSKLPITESLLYQYFFHTLNPLDSELQKSEINSLLKKVEKNTTVYTYFISTLFGLYINSPLPDHDKISNYIAESYILSPNHNKLFTYEYLQEIKTYTSFLKANPIGSLAPDIKLRSLSGQYESLYGIKTKLTLVLFYDPDCKTCDETLQQISDLYKDYAHKGLQIYAIYTQNDSHKWKQYVSSTAAIGEWIHVELGENSEDVFNLYPIAAIPSFFLLNQNKQIIGKDMSVKDLCNQVKLLLNK